MKVSGRASIVAVLVTLMEVASPSSAQAQWGNVNPPQQGQIGTTPVGENGNRKRVGVVAYCADLAHNAGDTGLQSNKRNVKNFLEKQNLSDMAFGGPGAFGAFPFPFTSPFPLPNWFADGPFNNLGQFGAQNIVDYLQYDDGIDRVRDVVLIDGDMVQPTAAQLARNLDIVIALTDNKCGTPIPAAIAAQAAVALAGFIREPNKGLVLTGFAFSSSLGFGDAIFAAGLSPLRKGGPELDLRCGRESVVGNPDPNLSDCRVGTCPTGCTISGNPPECFNDLDGTVCTQYQPWPVTADLACDHMLSTVRGPTTSSWATAITSPASVSPGATLCFNYDFAPAAAQTPSTPFLAINAAPARNIIAINAMPSDAVDIQKFWYGCILGNAIQWLSGDHNRCSTRGCR